ncbi:MAG TPA: sodium-independent anion transporter, partial [Burkholderiales bacterium]
GLYLYRTKAVIKEFLARGGHLQDIGEDNFFPVRSRPTEKLYDRLDPEICRHCQERIFRECQDRLPDGTPRRDAHTTPDR